MSDPVWTAQAIRHRVEVALGRAGVKLELQDAQRRRLERELLAEFADLVDATVCSECGQLVEVGEPE